MLIIPGSVGRSLITACNNAGIEMVVGKLGLGGKYETAFSTVLNDTLLGFCENVACALLLTDCQCYSFSQCLARAHYYCLAC